MIAQPQRSSLWPRILAAAILVPAALVAVYDGGWILGVWTTAAGLAMAREWVQIVHRETFGWRFAMHAAALGFSQTLLALGHSDWAFAAILVVALLGNVAAQRQGERGIWVALGIVYIAVPCLAFVWLRQTVPAGFWTVVWLLCVVWATDSVAYLAGSALGGPKLAPQISPNKTWAGAIGGLAAGVAATALLGQFLGITAIWPLIGAGLVLSLLTQCGDLAESILKRTFGVKNASDLIPGHGGALDRLDGLIFATLGLAAYMEYAQQSPLMWAVL
ncbi:MAG: phosphatidate cytidylyltransferase [Alphaproteobacteria bacterium]|nr:phosphatidate cytidylyltransferase [Alphaproteobacteria bacterium]